MNPNRDSFLSRLSISQSTLCQDHSGSVDCVRNFFVSVYVGFPTNQQRVFLLFPCLFTILLLMCRLFVAFTSVSPRHRQREPSFLDNQEQEPSFLDNQEQKPFHVIRNRNLLSSIIRNRNLQEPSFHDNQDQEPSFHDNQEQEPSFHDNQELEPSFLDTQELEPSFLDNQELELLSQ